MFATNTAVRYLKNNEDLRVRQRRNVGWLLLIWALSVLVLGVIAGLFHGLMLLAVDRLIFKLRFDGMTGIEAKPKDGSADPFDCLRNTSV